MYKSPIEMTYSELQTQMAQENENMVMKTIRKVGINVDKAELIKALRYDRNQYTKGYEDGKNDVLNDVLDKIRAEIEEQVLESLSDGGDDWFTAEKVNECLEIIDKYKAEKGVQNAISD